MDSLVSPDWLAAHWGDEDMVVLDASKHLPDVERDPRSDFEKAHIPGARFLDLASLTDTASAVPGALPRREQLADRLGALGVGTDSRIVLYDDSAIKSAARAWFMLRLFGHDRVAILDGGWAKWRSEDRPVESGSVAPEEVVYEARPERAIVRTKKDMLANLDSGVEQVVDARDADRFTGASVDTVHDLPGGHIPGARNLFFRDLFREDGTYRTLPELRAAVAKAGIEPDRPIVASCGSGMTASVGLFALHLIGRDDTALYDGSWAEWGADADTPKELGTAS